MILTSGSVQTQMLNGSNAQSLKDCHRIKIFSESTGWSYGYGFDSSGELIVAIHAHKEEDIREAIMDDDERESRIEEIQKQLDSGNLKFEDRRRLHKKLIKLSSNGYF